MSQIENNFIYDDKGVVANLVKPFERKDRFPSDKTSVFGSYNAALDYANNNPSAYVGQIISVVDGDGNVKVYKLIPSSNEAEYATLKELGEGGNTSAPSIGDLERFATVQWVKEQGYITLDEVPEVTVPTKVSELENDSEFITINEVPEVTVPTKTSELENDSKFITINEVPEVTVPTKTSELENDSDFITTLAIKELALNDDLVTLKDETYQEIQKIYSSIDAKANSGDVYVKNDVYTKKETDATFLSKNEAIGIYKVIDVFDYDRILRLNNGKLSSYIKLEFDSSKQKLVLYGNNNSKISEVDISNVISSGFLKDAEYDDTNKKLVFTFITENGTDRVVPIDLGDIIKTYTPGEGIDINNNGVISISTRKLEEIQSLGADIVRLSVNIGTGFDYTNGTTVASEIARVEGLANAAQSAADATQGDVDALENVVATKAAQSDLIAHTGNSEIHVNNDDKVKWNTVTEKAAQSDLDALAGRVSTAEGDVDALEGRMGTAEGKITAIETSLASGDIHNAIVAAQNAADAAQADVDAIAADYLKDADKTELEGKITAAQSAAVKGVKVNNNSVVGNDGIASIDLSNYIEKENFDSELDKKEDKLIDGVTIKTINGMSILGEGNIEVTSNGIIDMSKYVSLEKFEELESKYTVLNDIVETLKQEVESLKNGNINVGNAITELKSGSDDIKIERNGSVVTITLDDITNVTFGDGEDIESCDEIEGDESF